MAQCTLSGVGRSLSTCVMAVLLTTLVAGLAGCDSLGKVPNARVTDVRFANLSADGVTLEVDMEVRNPERSPLRLEGLDYAMIATEEDPAMGPILEGSAKVGEVTVAGRSKAKVTTPVTVAFTDVLDVLDAGDAGTIVPWRADLTLNGAVAASSHDGGAGQSVAAQMPMEVSGRLPIFKMPVIEASPFEWTDVGVLSAKGEVRVRVTNTNQFPLDLNRVVYALEIQGARVSSGGVSRGTRIAPGKTEEIVVPVRISAAKIAAAVYESSRRGGGSARLRGSIDLEADGIPLSLPFDQGTRFEQMRGTP